MADIELTPEQMKAAAAELGRRGSKAYRERIGEEAYRAQCRERGLRGGAAIKAKAEGTDYYKNLGRLGGTENAKRHGTEHYRRIGRLGGETVRKAFEALRAREAGE